MCKALTVVTTRKENIQLKPKSDDSASVTSVIKSSQHKVSNEGVLSKLLKSCMVVESKSEDNKTNDKGNDRKPENKNDDAAFESSSEPKCDDNKTHENKSDNNTSESSSQDSDNVVGLLAMPRATLNHIFTFLQPISVLYSYINYDNLF